MISRFYNKNIAEGKSFLIFAVIFALIIRVAYFLHPAITIETVKEGGYLWKPLLPIFTNPIYAVIGGSLLLVAIAFLVHHINIEHALIRRRTLLPPAIVLILFSCLPSQLIISPFYIGALVILLVINMVFHAYGTPLKQQSTYQTSFFLALGSLFAPMLLLYFPILWICLIRIRSFNFKAFLSSVFSILLLYIPAFAYFFIFGDIRDMAKPFHYFSDTDLSLLPILGYNLYEYITLGVALLLIVIVLIDNAMSSFKDKIRVRAFISVLTMFSVFSVICTLFLNADTQLTLYVALAVSSLQIAHYFSLAQQRAMSFVFFFFLLTFIVISILPFFPNL